MLTTIRVANSALGIRQLSMSVVDEQMKYTRWAPSIGNPCIADIDREESTPANPRGPSQLAGEARQKLIQSSLNCIHLIISEDRHAFLYQLPQRKALAMNFLVKYSLLPLGEQPAEAALNLMQGDPRLAPGLRLAPHANGRRWPG